MKESIMKNLLRSPIVSALLFVCRAVVGLASSLLDKPKTAVAALAVIGAAACLAAVFIKQRTRRLAF